MNRADRIRRLEAMTLRLDLLASKADYAERVARARGDRKALHLAWEGKRQARELARLVNRQRDAAGLRASYALYDRRLF